MRMVDREKESGAKLWANRLSIVCVMSIAAISGPVLFLLIMTIVESLQPGYDSIQQTISMLVLGSYGWLQTVVFFAFGLLFTVFAVRLYFAIAKPGVFKVGIAFLIIIGLSFIMIGIFPTQGPGAVPTLSSLVHKYTAGSIGALFPFACFFIAPGFRVDPHWRGWFVYTIATGLFALIVGILGAITSTEWSWGGLHERVLLLNGFVWIEVTAIRLLLLCIGARRK